MGHSALEYDEKAKKNPKTPGAGMMCGGCVGRVQRVLEGHAAVGRASVNLATETALCRVAPHRAAPADQPPLDALGAALVALLTDAGFDARVRDPAAGGASAAAVMTRKRDERRERLAAVTRKLAVAWLLAGTCLAGHLLHCWPGIFTASAALRLLASTKVHAALSYAALLGPGRGILADGVAALRGGRPDMNTLVALGAVSALGVSTAGAALPALGWTTFFEEPAMLLGVVLLGRTLEERAKLQARAPPATCAAGPMCCPRPFLPCRAACDCKPCAAFGGWGAQSTLWGGT